MDSGTGGGVVKGNLYELVKAHVEGVGLTEAARRAGMSKSTAHARLQTAEARELVEELRQEMRGRLLGWSGQVVATAERVLESVHALLDNDPDPAHVVRLAGIVFPEVRSLVQSAQGTEPETAAPLESAKDTLRAKLGLMEQRAHEVLAARGRLGVIHGGKDEE